MTQLYQACPALREGASFGGGFRNIPVKKSAGVILCRRNPKTLRIEVLLGHKRYSYAFSEFVFARYPRAGGKEQNRVTAGLLSRMTREELLLILSLDFSHMWYRACRTYAQRDVYHKKLAKFQSAFMRDGGVGLTALAHQARPRKTLLWEVPKGRPLNGRECDLLCATREMYEETGIRKNDYRILPGVKRRTNYVSCGTRYICDYYIAIANPQLAGQSFDLETLASVGEMTEISEIRWFDIERLRILDADSDAHLEQLVAPAFRLVRSYLRGRWGCRGRRGPLPLSLPEPPPEEEALPIPAPSITPPPPKSRAKKRRKKKRARVCR